MATLALNKDILFLDCREYTRKGSYILHSHVVHVYLPWIADMFRAMDRPVRFLMHQGPIVIVSYKDVLDLFQERYPERSFVQAHPAFLYETYSGYMTQDTLDTVSAVSQMSEILPKLFLSGSIHTSNKKSLDKYNIRFILNVTEEVPNAFERDPEFKYMQCSVRDDLSHDISKWFKATADFIDQGLASGVSVLVHCAAGVSRSATIMIMYLIQRKSCSLHDAYHHVLERRNIIEPNMAFYEQLLLVTSRNDVSSVSSVSSVSLEYMV